MVCFCSGSGPRALADGKEYVPHSGIAKGTKGAERVVLEIANQTTGDMFCTASLAHWYSVELGTTPPGGTVETALWQEPETGALNLLNVSGHRMPIEAIWCRLADAAREARSRIPLPYRAGATPARLFRICRDAPDGLFGCTETAG